MRFMAGILVAGLLLLSGRSAYADPTPARSEQAQERVTFGLWSTEKKVLILSTIGVGVAGFGVSAFSFVKSSAARRASKDEFPGGDCATTAACDRLGTLSRESGVWYNRGVSLFVAGGGAMAGALVMALLVPNGQISVSPSASASRDGASFSLAGRF